MTLSGKSNHGYIVSAKSNYLGLPRWQRCFLLFILLLFSVLTLLETQPKRRGDGHEYILMSQAFLSHGTPDIIRDDQLKIVEYNGNRSLIGFVRSAPLTHEGSFPSPPYFKSKSGKIYSYHFWLYSLINTPSMFVTRISGFPDTYSFLITNFLLALGASLVIFSSVRLSNFQRLSFLGFFWVCGTTYYLRWGHPEVFSAAFTCCSLVLFHDRSYVSAAIFAAIASMQNPPLAILAAAMIGLGFALSLRENGLKNMAVTIPLYFFASILVFFAPLFWRINFDTWSLISKCGSANTGLISADRVLSLFLDLNQGMIVGSGFYFIAISILILISMLRKKFHFLLPQLFLIIIVILMAALSTATTNLSSDYSTVSRYAYWLSIPIGFSAILLIDSDIKFSFLIIFAFICQFYIVCSQKVWGEESYCKMNRFSKSILSKYPFLYNPIPEIFIERVMNSETFPTDGVAMYTWVYKNRITKVLFQRGEKKNIAPEVKEIEIFAHQVLKMEGGWEYWNFHQRPYSKLRNGGHQHLKSAEDIIIKLDANSDEVCFPVGWCMSEQTHRWSHGDVSEINFRLKKPGKTPTRINILGFSLGAQNAEIKLNGSLIFRGVIPDGGLVDIVLPSGTINTEGQAENLLKFDWPDARSPGKGDSRVLAFALQCLELQ